MSVFCSNDLYECRRDLSERGHEYEEEREEKDCIELVSGCAGMVREEMTRRRNG